MYRRFIKRTLDLLISTVLILLCFPVLILVVIGIKIDSRGPIFFNQIRLGKNKQEFRLLKFRTMYFDHATTSEQVLPGSSLITRIGSYLRISKVDELPQLLNVLCGHMSLVGPRPCLPELLGSMDDESRKRFEVRPGLTGLAQVNGNVYISWEERWKFDVAYVQHLSFINDIGILMRTVLVVILGEKKFGKQPEDGEK